MQLEVAALHVLPAGTPSAGPALEALTRGAAAKLANGARVDVGPDALAGWPGSHAWFNTGLAGRGDFYATLVGDTIYTLLLLQHLAFDPRLLERAKAGLQIDADRLRTSASAGL